MSNAGTAYTVNLEEISQTEAIYFILHLDTFLTNFAPMVPFLSMISSTLKQML